MRTILRLVSSLFIVLVIFLSGARMDIAERNVPVSATFAATLDTTDSTLGKEATAAALARLSAGSHTTIALVAVDPQDPVGSPTRFLYTMGGNPAAASLDDAWFASVRTGGVASFDPQGSVPIAGTYAFWGDPHTQATLESWAQENAIAVTTLHLETPVLLTVETVLTGQAFVPLLALVLGGIVCILVISARQAQAKTQLLLSGVGSGRIAAEALIKTLGLALVPAVPIALIAAVVAWLASGPELGLVYLSGMVHLLLIYYVLIGLIAVCLSLVTWPNVESLARRRPGTSGIVFTAEAVKVAAIALTFILLPTTIGGLLTAQSMRDEAALWTRFTPGFAVNNFGTVPGTPGDDAASTKFAQVISDAGDHALIALDLGSQLDIEENLAGSSFDGVIIANPAFVHHALESPGGSPAESLRPALPEEIGSAGITEIFKTVALQLAQPKVSRVSDVLHPSVLTTSAAFPVPTGRYRDAMHVFQHPLILVSEHPAQELSGSFLQAATTKSGVIFVDEAQLRQLLRVHGLGSHPTVDSVSALGLLDLQQRQTTLMYYSVAAIALLFATVLSLWVSASSYIAARSRRFVPLTLSEVSFGRAFRRRLVCELGIILILGVATFGFTAARGATVQAGATVIVITAVSGVLSVIFHAFGYRHIMRRAFARRAL